MTNRKLEKWKRWIKDIHEDVFRNLDIYLVIYKQICCTMNKDTARFNRNSHMHYYLPNTTYAFIAIGIRRQLKVDAKSKSFATLIQDMIDNQIQIWDINSREYRRLSAESKDLLNNQGFIDSTKIQHDYAKIIKEFKITMSDIDKRFAHFDKKNLSQKLNYNNIEKSFDILKTLVKKYHLLLCCNTGGSYNLDYLQDDIEQFLGIK